MPIFSRKLLGAAPDMAHVKEIYDAEESCSSERQARHETRGSCQSHATQIQGRGQEAEVLRDLPVGKGDRLQPDGPLSFWPC